jgi:hypothetical protein
MRKNSSDKSTMTHLEKNIRANGYATWNRYGTRFIIRIVPFVKHEREKNV